MTQPKVTIIILNWNGKEDTIECLESLKHITYPNYEILLVDNGSTDGSVECFRERYPGLEIIETGENLGFAEGNNVAVRRVMKRGDDYILLLNNDTKVTGDFLNELIKVSENDSKIAITQSKILKFNGKIDNMGILCDIYGATLCKRSESQNSLFFYASGACMLIKTKIIKHDLFDKKLFAYHEDVDLGWQVRLQNYKIGYAHNSICYHKGSAVLKNSPKKMYYIWRNRMRVLIKNYSTKNILKRLPLAIILEFYIALGHTIVQKDIRYINAFSNGFFWNVRNIKGTLKERKYIQSTRKVKDVDLEKYMEKYSLELLVSYGFFKRFL